MSPVVFSELNVKNNKKIAIAELNAEQTLNALNLSMINSLYEKLQAWQSDDDIALVILQGAGNKAFCAGGDVVSLYHALKPEHERIASEHITSDSITKQFVAKESIGNKTIDDNSIVDSVAYDFFATEYQLDQLIHQFAKPILVWGDGYIMGGGVGLFAAASHKVVTEKSLLAMPESTIGLYPDVGGSWFLNKMPNNIGLFLGLTGAIFNAADALAIGLANVAIISSARLEVIESLKNVAWQDDQSNFNLLDQSLMTFTQKSAPVFSAIASPVTEHQTLINQLTSFDNGIDIYNTILALETDNDWLKKAQAKLSKGSALSAMLIHHQLKRSKNFTLEQCFTSELNLSLRCCQFTEFSEGVRALLVAKDKNPQWAYNDINDIPNNLLAWFFTAIEMP